MESGSIVGLSSRKWKVYQAKMEMFAHSWGLQMQERGDEVIGLAANSGLSYPTSGQARTTVYSS